MLSLHKLIASLDQLDRMVAWAGKAADNVNAKEAGALGPGLPLSEIGLSEFTLLLCITVAVLLLRYLLLLLLSLLFSASLLSSTAFAKGAIFPFQHRKGTSIYPTPHFVALTLKHIHCMSGTTTSDLYVRPLAPDVLSRRLISVLSSGARAKRRIWCSGRHG